MSDNNRYPAPWNLAGRGLILIFKFSKKEIQSDKFLCENFKTKFAGGFGAVMIVEYKSSNAGPYNELLMIPGSFNYNGKKKKTISKIFVSTEVSVKNGRENWAIPKELGTFQFQEQAPRCTEVQVSDKGKTFFKMTFRKGRVPFPVHTACMPFPLVQEHDGHAFFTKFTGHGRGHFAKIQNIEIDSRYFPDISKKKPRLAILVDPFYIQFPVPEILRMETPGTEEQDTVL